MCVDTHFRILECVILIFLVLSNFEQAPTGQWVGKLLLWLGLGSIKNLLNFFHFSSLLHYDSFLYCKILSELLYTLNICWL